jgi:hypothetical protein
LMALAEQGAGLVWREIGELLLQYGDEGLDGGLLVGVVGGVLDGGDAADDETVNGEDDQGHDEDRDEDLEEREGAAAGVKIRKSKFENRNIGFRAVQKNLWPFSRPFGTLLVMANQQGLKPLPIFWPSLRDCFVATHFFEMLYLLRNT